MWGDCGNGKSSTHIQRKFILLKYDITFSNMAQHSSWISKRVCQLLVKTGNSFLWNVEVIFWTVAEMNKNKESWISILSVSHSKYWSLRIDISIYNLTVCEKCVKLVALHVTRYPWSSFWFWLVTPAWRGCISFCIFWSDYYFYFKLGLYLIILCYFEPLGPCREAGEAVEKDKWSMSLPPPPRRRGGSGQTGCGCNSCWAEGFVRWKQQSAAKEDCFAALLQADL